MFPLTYPHKKNHWDSDLQKLRPGDWSHMSNPCILKMVVEKIMHLAWKMGKGNVVLKPYVHANIKGYILQQRGRCFSRKPGWFSNTYSPSRQFCRTPAQMLMFTVCWNEGHKAAAGVCSAHSCSCGDYSLYSLWMLPHQSIVHDTEIQVHLQFCVKVFNRTWGQN
jgi:hypothetical protein